ncbi:MAG TPA: FGGY-family carbohydrate kinase [Firmicutes bacterium]|nr:FGGY-family carbohydrate kinase [Bacillota bacterium]
MTKYLVGCDIGTGGTKAVVMSSDGEVLGNHFVEYPLITPRPGWAEHDPEWYWNAVAETIRVAIQRSRVSNRDIVGVSLSALSPACILVDKDLKPLQNAHIWMDRRATAECKWLKENIGDDRVFELSGNPIDPYYATAKLMWEKNNRPELYSRSYKMLTAKDYPMMKLTGQPVTDYSNASLIGIAFDIRKRRWDEDLIEEIGLDVEKFPEVHPCDEVIGEVTPEAAAATGLAPGTPVVAGTVDCNAAWVSNGITEEGDNSLVMGTAGVWGVVHDEPVFTRNMITIIHTAESRRKYTTLAALVSCGALIRYFRDTYGQLEVETGKKLDISPYDVMNLEAEKVPPGSDGLIILPYFMGERTPIWDPLARGVVFGLSLAHGRGHLIRAMMEAVGYGIRHNMELVRERNIKINSPTFLGEGGAQSRLWRHIICDILNVKGAYMAGGAGAPVGNAICAGVGVGVFKDYSVAKEFVKVTEVIEPDPEKHEYYTRLYRIYRDLYPALRRHFEDLASATGYL